MQKKVDGLLRQLNWYKVDSARKEVSYFRVKEDFDHICNQLKCLYPTNLLSL